MTHSPTPRSFPRNSLALKVRIGRPRVVEGDCSFAVGDDEIQFALFLRSPAPAVVTATLDRRASPRPLPVSDSG